MKNPAKPFYARLSTGICTTPREAVLTSQRAETAKDRASDLIETARALNACRAPVDSIVYCVEMAIRELRREPAALRFELMTDSARNFHTWHILPFIQQLFLAVAHHTIPDLPPYLRTAALVLVEAYAKERRIDLSSLPDTFQASEKKTDREIGDPFNTFVDLQKGQTIQHLLDAWPETFGVRHRIINSMIHDCHEEGYPPEHLWGLLDRLAEDIVDEFPGNRVMHYCKLAYYQQQLHVPLERIEATLRKASESATEIGAYADAIARLCEIARTYHALNLSSAASAELLNTAEGLVLYMRPSGRSAMSALIQKTRQACRGDMPRGGATV